MNKPSWLSWINFLILSFLLCTYLGFINPKSWIDNIHSKLGIEVITPIQTLENKYHNLITKEEFNKYQHLSKSNVDWIIGSIKNLQGNINLSNQIAYWKSEYEKKYCDDNDYINRDVCKNINTHLFNLEQKLSK